MTICWNAKPIKHLNFIPCLAHNRTSQCRIWLVQVLFFLSHSSKELGYNDAVERSLLETRIQHYEICNVLILDYYFRNCIRAKAGMQVLIAISHTLVIFLPYKL